MLPATDARYGAKHAMSGWLCEEAGGKVELET